MSEETRGWRIVPGESWKSVVAEYSERIEAVRALDPWNVAMPDGKWERDSLEKCVFAPGTDDPLISALSRLYVFALNSRFIALQVSQTVADLWERGQFILVPLNTRFVIECWARIHYAKKEIGEKILSGSDLKAAERKLDRLTFGTRTEAHLPWGGTQSEINSIHINDCLRSLDDIHPAIMDSYGFLSESSHPSFTENGYFQMAGPPISNWDNKAYEAIMRPMLERCFRLFEQAVFGACEDAVYFIELNNMIEQVKRNGAQRDEP